jgi:hypothetical protein
MMAPLYRGFNFEHYDRELRRPFPAEPEFAPDSKVWWLEHAIAAEHMTSVRDNAHSAVTSGAPSLEF